jgi:hypothetical protein
VKIELVDRIVQASCRPLLDGALLVAVRHAGGDEQRGEAKQRDQATHATHLLAP